MNETMTAVHNAFELVRSGLVEFLKSHHGEAQTVWVQEFSRKHNLEGAPERWPVTDMLWFLGALGHKFCATDISDMARAISYELRAWLRSRPEGNVSAQDVYRIVDSAARLLQQLRVSQAAAARALRDSLWQGHVSKTAKVFIAPEEILQKLRQPTQPMNIEAIPFTLTELCHIILENAGEFMSSRDIHHRLKQAGFHYNLKSISLTLNKDPRFTKQVVGRRYFWGLSAWASRPQKASKLTEVRAGKANKLLQQPQ